MKTFLFLLACIASTAVAQNIIVEKVPITETVDKKYISNIPRLKDSSNPKNPIVEKINATLLERFELPSYNQKEVTEFRWYEIKFDSEIKSNMVYIHYSGEYYGAYPSPVEEELFFDLTTGDEIKNTDIPFQALFTLNGYLDFLNKHWLKGAKIAFQKAIDCASTDPYCSYYDISTYRVENGKLFAKIVSDCYPHVVMACAPDYSISVSVDSVKPYLTEAAKKMLLQDRYSEKHGVDKFLYNKSAWKNISDNMFLFGRIDDKYPISMALAIDASGGITGYYYYDKRMQKLNLKGTYANNILDMTESVNNKQTGKFYFTWTDQYNEEAFAIYDANATQYLNGTWLSMDGTKKWKIQFTEVVTTGK